MTVITKKVRATSDKVVGFKCDRCKKVYNTNDFGGDGLLETLEFHHIAFTGGYASFFGDMCRVEADLCQHCLKQLIGSFAKVTDG